MIKSTSAHKEYTVNLDGKPYPIFLGRGIVSAKVMEVLTNKTINKNIVILFDAHFAEEIDDILRLKLAQEGYTVYLYPMEAGKQNKTINQAIKIYELLETNNLSRDSTVIAVGGGVIGDLAGFVASTYLRGMNLIHVPTTITAMIDSSIGGKVAINFRNTINAIGNYYHPILNILDLDFIETLPLRELKAGLGEIIKCAIIADKDFFKYLKANNEAIFKRDEDVLMHIMSRAIEIKLDHVTGDVYEQEQRLKLNYGHTVGHAIEVSTSVLEEVYRHGEGVALGMVGAAYIADKYFGQGREILDRHEDILRLYDLPIRLNAPAIGFDSVTLIDDCMMNVYKDKKRKDNKLRFILPCDIGRCEVASDIPEALIREAFEYLIGGAK